MQIVKYTACTVVVVLSMWCHNAWGQQCNNSSLNIELGSGSRSGNTDAIANLNYNCQANDQPTYYTLCLFAGEGTAPATGLVPRRLTNYNNGYLNYNLYSNPARTNIIGPPPTGGGYPVYTWNVLVPGAWQQPTFTIPIYTRLNSIPAGTESGAYQAQLANNQIRYSWSNTGYPSSCLSGNIGVSNLYIGVNATSPSGCSMNITSASNMDFGTTSSLNKEVNSSSAIQLECPSNTQWQLALNNGLNAVGTTRRMRNQSNYVRYELYQDSARTKRWGNTANSDTYTGNGGAATIVVPVYGRVPTQSNVPAGSYSDTITVTLSY